MTERLVGKRTIVTGAGSGIGQAAARLFAAEGARVLCADIDESSAMAVADEIGERAVGLRVDVTNPEGCAAMVRRAVEDFGGLDAVYANAGIAGAGRAADLEVEDWDRVIAVNLTGVWLSIKYAIPHLVEAGGGSLVLQASVGGVIGVPNIAPYAAAKAGVIGLARQMAVDYGPDNIRVNAICPGTVPTPLVRATYEKAGGFAAVADVGPGASIDDMIAAAVVRNPLGRLGTTADIANLALYLASDESSWVTGAAITVDGGMSVA
ncbi:MAG: SDR family NAD(P)-dependent oxidoreductase [bacterium]|nr:SDR family NAD(P)-dependent oxidoreductase [bacterium]